MRKWVKHTFIFNDVQRCVHVKVKIQLFFWGIGETSNQQRLVAFADDSNTFETTHGDSIEMEEMYSGIVGVPLQNLPDGLKVYRKSVVEEGDIIILLKNFEDMEFVKVKSGEQWSSRQGNFMMKNFIGKPFGSLVYADNPPSQGRRGRRGRSGWVVLLQPSPQLWTIALSHRTQILYQADISYIILRLEIKSGSVVYESGTGSGSLSTALCQTIAPEGYLNTFEFNEHRVDEANNDFKLLKIDHIVKVRHRNVVQDGLHLDPSNPQNDAWTADAVFLDLPLPWLVLQSALEVLKPNGMVCTFSPCIEQVQKTCLVLKELGFIEVCTVENLVRTFEARDDHFKVPVFAENSEPYIKKQKMGSKRARNDGQNGQLVTKPFHSMKGHTSYLTFARKPNLLQ